VADNISFAVQVEAQEKPKVPKGRALKRLKYTRRFVNITLTGGKRKVRTEQAPRGDRYSPERSKAQDLLTQGHR
jgi:hypothetical protein